MKEEQGDEKNTSLPFEVSSGVLQAPPTLLQFLNTEFCMSKTKYVTQHCVSCNRDAKMEIRMMEGAEAQIWYRCTRCHHSMMLDRSQLTAEPAAKPTRDSCIAYTPANKYDVGVSIYHTDWDDMGMVTSKERTSSGGNAIWVSFEKNGSRRLIENLQED